MGEAIAGANKHLVSDLYSMLLQKKVGVSKETEEAILDNMAENMKNILRDTFGAERDNRKLRLSGVGRDDRFLWMQAKNPLMAEESFTPETYMKFLFGHLTEEMMLALVKLTGNTVTDEQKTVSVAGVTGHMDCKINGVIVDVKSASSFGFKKFRNNTLHVDDPFGYIGQNKAYAYAEGDKVYGWLAFDKSSGAVCYLEYDEDDLSAPYQEAVSYDAKERVKHVKKLVGFDESPKEACAEPKNYGKSGNMVLSTTCSYCPYKSQCWPGLRTFLYSSGPVYFTDVKQEPKVSEITDEF